MRWHPTCQYLATGSADRTVRLWDITSGSCVRIFVGARAPVRFCDRNCGREVSTPIYRLRDITSGSCVRIFVGARTLLCPCIAILHNCIWSHPLAKESDGHVSWLPVF